MRNSAFHRVLVSKQMLRPCKFSCRSYHMVSPNRTKGNECHIKPIDKRYIRKLNIMSMSSETSIKQAKKMRLVVFNLDYTIWQPEMFQLYGEPKLMPIEKVLKIDESPSVLKRARTTKEGHVLTDGSRTPMQSFDGASYALTEINQLRTQGYDIRAAVASKTDEPQWAKKCLKHLIIEDGSTLESCFGRDMVEISYGNKSEHFQRLHEKTGIPYEEMSFFDNESWSIQSVSKLGVKCFHTPDGMTRTAWEEAKKHFDLL